MVRKGSLIVDAGCGYGRMSDELLSIDPTLRFVGIDFSETYMALYSSPERNGIVADLHAVPIRAGLADALICVTALMYVSPACHDRVVGDLLGLLRPGGVALVVEPGSEVLDLKAKFVADAGDRLTPSAGFSATGFERLFEQFDCEIIAKGANPAFTIASPALRVGWLRRPAAWVASWLARFDRRIFKNPKKFAVHRWVLVRVASGPKVSH